MNTICNSEISDKNNLHEILEKFSYQIWEQISLDGELSEEIILIN
jgi:hypothetical protein